jgi:ferritin
VADNNGFWYRKFSFRHAAEERNHMMKILEYILNRGEAKVKAIPAPATDPVSVNNCFEKYLSTK